MTAVPHSYLFVPGDRPERFARAAGSGAHRIVLDLEDAVGPDAKEGARAHVRAWFASGGAGVVRINGADTPWFDADLAALAAFPAAEIMVPKAEPGSLARVGAILADRPLVALVETVAGLVDIHAVAASASVTRLAFGHLDFGVDARMPGPSATFDPARFEIALASRHAGLAPPIDGVTVALDDEEALAADVARARNLGFSAKLCIHPRQVGPVNAAFAPSADELAWARRIMAAVGESRGSVVQLDKKMVDKPLVDQARAILVSASAFDR
ncbi:CoA ester lyase [Rhizobiaceae bacterium BDR2-2]|uniref:CoA ester lyase n=1 Tax=Ectorhizobium quercum TaxID=2965071 RepID=A0AAE3MY67_9HYPH|nr:CoA ester lyase [Ectorhizobium quercum]MCX8997198.1 CoA ester lyase [Ectorhizobium quercum]